MSNKELLLDFISSRTSKKKLTLPMPSDEEITQILRAGLRAPDHGRLKPYHFTVVKGYDKMRALSDLLKQSATDLKLPEKFHEKAEKFATRAPMCIVITTRLDPNHKKVPAWEQIVTAGCATLNMQLAANALGYDNFWVTTKWINGEVVRKAFGVEKEHDKIVAVLLIGTDAKDDDKVKELHKEAARLPEYVSHF